MKLRLDERRYSPDLQRRLAETTAAIKSFEQTAAVAKCWIDLALSSRHAGRVIEELGAELVDHRDAFVDDIVHHRQEVEGPDPEHELAAVFVDGGRVQTRAEKPGQGNGVHDPHWQEDKIARLQTMTTQTFAVDPCPEPPACFLDVRKLEQFLDPKETCENPASAAESVDLPRERWQPKPLARSCVATMRGIDEFRWMVMAEAKRRHFFTAQRRAFVADGQAYNWTLHAGQFSDFVPILDFLHLASYLYAAAKVGDAATVDQRYECWVRAAWQGRSGEILTELQASLTQAGIDDTKLPDDHAWGLRNDGPTLREQLAKRPGCVFRRRSNMKTPSHIANGVA